MLSSGKYKSVLNLEAKYDIFHEILRLLHMMNVRFSLLNMAQRILGVTLPNF